MSTLEPHSEAESVWRANQAWVAAGRARDLDGIMSYIAEAAVFQPPGEKPLTGHRAVREFYEEVLKLPSLDFDATPDEILVARSGELCMDVGHFHTIVETEGARARRQGKYLAVWQKASGEWRCIALSFSGNRD